MNFGGHKYSDHNACLVCSRNTQMASEGQAELAKERLGGDAVRGSVGLRYWKGIALYSE